MKTLLAELSDLLGQLIEIESGRISLNLSRRTLANVAAQFRAMFA